MCAYSKFDPVYLNKPRVNSNTSWQSNWTKDLRKKTITKMECGANQEKVHWDEKSINKKTPLIDIDGIGETSRK